MLYILKITEPVRRGFFARLKVRFKGAPLKVERLEIRDMDVCVCTCESDRLHEKLPELGHISPYFVMPKKLPLPQGCPFQPYPIEKLKQQLFLYTALDLLSALHRKAEDVVLTLVDWEGKFPYLLKHFLPHSAHLQVATRAQEVYEAVAQQLLEDTGASVFVTSHLDSGYLTLFPEQRKIQFLIGSSRLFIDDYLTGMPEGFEAVVNREYDETAVSAAIMTLYTSKRLPSLKAERMLVNGRVLTRDECVKLVLTLDSQLEKQYNSPIIDLK